MFYFFFKSGQAFGKPSFFNVLISPVTSYQKTCGTTPLFLPTWPQIHWWTMWILFTCYLHNGSGLKFIQLSIARAFQL